MKNEFVTQRPSWQVSQDWKQGSVALQQQGGLMRYWGALTVVPILHIYLRCLGEQHLCPAANTLWFGKKFRSENQSSGPGSMTSPTRIVRQHHDPCPYLHIYIVSRYSVQGKNCCTGTHGPDKDDIYFCTCKATAAVGLGLYLIIYPGIQG